MTPCWDCILWGLSVPVAIVIVCIIGIVRTRRRGK